jgi:hypothetical protein
LTNATYLRWLSQSVAPNEKCSQISPAGGGWPNAMPVPAGGGGEGK